MCVCVFHELRFDEMVLCFTYESFSFLFQVNDNFAIDLIAEQPVSEVGSRVIACDGGGGALGHPKVYINLVTCPVLSSGPYLQHTQWD